MSSGTKGRVAASFVRATSCFGETKETVLSALLANDLQLLTSALAEVAPVGDHDSVEKDGKARFPLPEDHWMQSPCGAEHGHRTLLEMAAAGANGSEAVRLLLAAGARADHYNEAAGTTALHEAVAAGSVQTVEILLDMLKEKPKINRANVNGFNSKGQTVLHLAAEAGDVRMLSALLARRDLDDVDARDLSGGRTPLYLAARARQAAAAELLLSRGADAGVRCFGKTVREHLRETMPYLNVDSVKVEEGRARKRLDVCSRLSELLDRAAFNARKGLSNAHNLLQFRIYLSLRQSSELDAYDAGGMALFQKACKDGLAEHVKEMLGAGMDPNATTIECSSRPVLLAAFEGHHEVLAVLRDDMEKKRASGGGKAADFLAVEEGGRESVLSWVLAKPNAVTHDNRVDYAKCLQVLMSPALAKDIARLVNCRDEQRNTALHLAALQWDQGVVRALLEMGANIGVKNIHEEVPVTFIDPATMEAFLDEFCVTSKHDVGNEDLEITYNYAFLAPPPIDDPLASAASDLEENKQSSGKDRSTEALPETEALWYMSQSERHRHLLKHPVINSFLWLKWHKIEGFVNRNLRLYFLFVMVLSWYVFERFGGVGARATVVRGGHPYCSPLKERSETALGGWFWAFVVHMVFQLLLVMRDWRRGCYHVSCGATKLTNFCLCTIFEALMLLAVTLILWRRSEALWLVLSALLVVLTARELFQMAASLRRYICSPENWLEMAMMALVGVVLWCPDSYYGDSNCEVKRHLAGVTVMLAWVEFVTLVARHPRLTSYNVYVTMFYRVMTTFLTFLLWYCFFIVSFGLGFYIMLHRDTGEEGEGDEDGGEEGNRFFNRPWLTLVKTSTMFVGELEFGDLPIAGGPMSWLAYLFLLAFVFLIVVVLMNLLNGLAVSDTGLIRAEAEIVASVSRVETISYVESLLLGDPFDFLSNWPPLSLLRAAMPSLACSRLLCRHRAVKDLSVCVTGATGVLLFYATLPDRTLTVRPNKRGVSCLAAAQMDERIVAATKRLIVQKRQRAGPGEGDVAGLADRMEALEEKLDSILRALKINKA